MLPVALIFSSGVASGVNSYGAVLVLGLLGRFAHIAAVPPVLERPLVLAAAAVLYIGQFVVGKIPVLDSMWDVVHTALRPVAGAAVGVVMAQRVHADPAVTIAAAALGGGSALASHLVKTGMRVGVNLSPEPFSNIAASILEDLGVAGLVSFAVFNPLAAAILAAVVLAAGLALFALLVLRVRVTRSGVMTLHGSIGDADYAPTCVPVTPGRPPMHPGAGLRPIHLEAAPEGLGGTPEGLGVLGHSPARGALAGVVSGGTGE